MNMYHTKRVTEYGVLNAQLMWGFTLFYFVAVLLLKICKNKHSVFFCDIVSTADHVR